MQDTAEQIGNDQGSPNKSSWHRSQSTVQGQMLQNSAWETLPGLISPRLQASTVKHSKGTLGLVNGSLPESSRCASKNVGFRPTELSWDIS